MAEEKTESVEKSEWVKMKPAELEKLVVELYKKGNSPAKIGLLLRDEHGVPKAKLISKKIVKILEGAKISVSHGRETLEKEIDSLKQHAEKNKHDVPAKRTLTRKIWALERIKKAS